MPGLRVRGLTRRLGGSPALEDVDLEVAQGELLVVVGPSGAGKTTLLRLVAGLDRPDAGTVEIGGRDVTATPPDRRDVAMVFQDLALFPHLTVEQNVAFGLRGRGTGAGRRTEARAAAERLGLGDLLARRPHELSGGQRQRVALARALARRPSVLLLDEPLSSLDAPLRTGTRAELRRLHDEGGLTTVHVTHDQAEALSLGDRVAVLHDGRVEQVGDPQEVYDAPASTWVAGFLGDPPMNFLRRGGRGPVVGVRPEHLVPADDGEIEGELAMVEAHGHERVWLVRTRGAEVRARVPPGRPERPGDRVRLRIERALKFDPDTGRSLQP